MIMPKNSSLLLPLVLGVAMASGGCHSRDKDVVVVRRIHTPKAAADAAEYPMIVRLVGRHYDLTASSGPHGVVYSAHDSEGKLVVANATLDELRLRHPEVYQQILPAIAEHGGESDRQSRTASDAAEDASDDGPIPISDVSQPGTPTGRRGTMILMSARE